MAGDFSVVKNNPKAVGSEDVDISEEVHGSEEAHGSDEGYRSVEAHGSEGAHGLEMESVGSEEDSDGSEEDSDGSEEECIGKQVISGKLVDGDPLFYYRPGYWQSVFQICEIKVLQSSGCRKKKSEQIYGKICLHHEEGGVWNLFDQEKEDSETIDVPGFITVTPPVFGISAFDQLWIRFAMEGGLKGMNEMYVEWMPSYDPFDELQAITLRGKDCSMQVSFIAFGEAVLADMDIDLLNMPNEEEIYGTITASFHNMRHPRRLFLFNKKVEDCVCVEEEELIPLSRPFIAVPICNALEINVNLCTVSGASVAQGTISIFPESLGRWFGVLGTHDQIQVRAVVIFCPYNRHPPTKKAPKLYGFPRGDKSNDE